MTPLELAKNIIKLPNNQTIEDQRWLTAELLANSEFQNQCLTYSLDYTIESDSYNIAKAYIICSKLCLICLDFVPGTIMAYKRNYDYTAEGVDISAIQKLSNMYFDNAKSELKKISDSLNSSTGNIQLVNACTYE